MPKTKQLASGRVSFNSGSLAPKSKFLPTFCTASPFKKERKGEREDVRKERRNFPSIFSPKS